jgi:hypothetical protein
MLSNNTLHTSPAIAIASLHFPLLTHTCSSFLSVGLVSPHSPSAVHCIQNHRLLSRAPVRRCIPPFSNYRSSQARGHPPILAVLTSQSSQASTHMQLSSRCQITLQTRRPHSSACCSILRLAKRPARHLIPSTASSEMTTQSPLPEGGTQVASHSKVRTWQFGVLIG